MAITVKGNISCSGGLSGTNEGDIEPNWFQSLIKLKCVFWIPEPASPHPIAYTIFHYNLNMMYSNPFFTFNIGNQSQWPHLTAILYFYCKVNCNTKSLECPYQQLVSWWKRCKLEVLYALCLVFLFNIATCIVCVGGGGGGGLDYHIWYIRILWFIL